MSDSNKHAVIIGGTHGIGLATAELLIQSGVTVILTGRRTAPIQSVKQKLGDSAIVLQADIQTTASISQLNREIEQHLGGEKIDLLFINAGYAALEPIASVTEESFDRIFNTNVKGAFFIAQSLAPRVRDGGAIVFTTSVANKAGIPGMAAYSASKAALQSLVQTFAAEFATRRIRVTAVSPGFVKTPTMGVVDASKDSLESFEKGGVDSTPLNRIARPEEVARVVLFLGFEATFTTGTELVVDGGLASLKGEFSL
ncbi:putative short chain dehydrogenase [Leptodontidium sp. 2 PMI_412]|nr:putative short chain dehydrogenase [Leptodontidium sp. 2 PMI_412]